MRRPNHTGCDTSRPAGRTNLQSAGIAALAAACTLFGSAACFAGWWPGFAPPPDGKGLNYYAYDLENYNGQLVVGGYFTQAGHNVQGHYVCAWDGTRWISLQNGTDGMVIALHALGGSLYVGGAFQHVGYLVTPANRVARWDGTEWYPVGTGFDDYVLALGEYQGRPVAGGYFTSSGGVAVNLIAEWDGEAWQPLGSGLSGGPAPRVEAMAEYGDCLYVGGQFTQAGTTAVSNLARWDGTSWSACGAVTQNNAMWGDPVEVISTASNGALLVGGAISTMDGVPCNGLAEWNGTAWTPLGLGLDADADVNDVAVYNGGLVAFGYLTGPSGVGMVGRWDGVTWKGLDDGLTFYDRWGGKGALAVYRSELYACGNVSLANHMLSSFIARWTDAGSTASPEIASVRRASWSVAPLSNPVSGAARIQFASGEIGQARLDIFDVQGRLVARLFEGRTGPETRTVTWNGRADAGPGVASGVYFVRLADDHGRQRASAKLTVVR